ncbi:MAG: alpha/beta hydrolase [Candidatus Paceibacterota bacterium]|jgi:hypothetical protein
MKTAIIIHGMPSKEQYFDLEGSSESNKHWLPWLQKQLIAKGILAQTPEMPEPYNPDYKKWCSVFERFEIDENTHLIGHSCGAGFIVRWLSENNIKVGKVVLVAPWINPNGMEKTKMFDFNIDENLVNKTRGITVFNSTNDEKEMQDSVKIIREKVKNIKIRDFKNYGHFCFRNMKTDAFPELLEEIIKQ